MGISRRLLIAGGMISAGALVSPYIGRRTVAETMPVEPRAARLIAAARTQIGVTLAYDPRYTVIDYPNGDVARGRGVCTDVVIRAYRDGLDLDLQWLVHEDMAGAFSAYPKAWGLKTTDRNIDHRRVPNLETFFKRRGQALDASEAPERFHPGDIVTQRLDGGQPHIMIVSDRLNAEATRPLVLHNIGRGAQEEDVLARFRIVGRFRYSA
jgi:uncharacterized protein YijF (DUF1287 family)